MSIASIQRTEGKIDRGSVFIVVIITTLAFVGYSFVGGVLPTELPGPNNNLVTVHQPTLGPAQNNLQLYTFSGATITPFPTLPPAAATAPGNASSSGTIASDTSPYGVTTIHADQQLITDFHDTNIHWIRYQIAGTPNWSSLDADVQRLNAAGIHIDFSIHCLGGGSCFSNPQLAPASAYASLATQLASRYNGTHGTIDAFEIGNEEFDSYPPSTYPPYLKAGCQAVKAANPKALCGMYGTVNPNLSHLSSVVSAIFTAGDGQYMDFMNYHYYVHGQNPANPGGNLPSFNQVWQSFHQIASANGFPQLPIWVTETGWPTAAVSCCQAVSPQTQSQYMQYVLDQARTSGVIQRVFWFTMDYGDQGDSLDRTSTGRLPAFMTLQNYIKQYPSWGS